MSQKSRGKRYTNAMKRSLSNRPYAEEDSSSIIRIDPVTGFPIETWKPVYIDGLNEGEEPFPSPAHPFIMKPKKTMVEAINVDGKRTINWCLEGDELMRSQIM